MPVALLQPGVYIEELSSGVRTISGVATSITLFVGWTPRGPVDKALRLTSFADYERSYGGLDQRSDFGHSVRHFYENGGSDAYILSVVDTATAATAKCALSPLTVEASSPGEWAHDFSVRVTARVADATHFTLDVIQPTPNNAVLETFANLSMDPTDARFAPKVINGRSAFIDNLVAGTTARPADGTVALGAGTPGNRGTVIGPNNAGFLTQLLAAFATGGIADRIDLFNLVCVPGLVDKPTVQVLQGNVGDRRAFLIVDCEEGDTVASTPATLSGMTGASGRNAAFFFPRVKAPDPLHQNALTDYPPCGFVAGIFASTDAARGVWKAPAGTEAGLSGAAGLALRLSDAETGQLNPHAVNCLRTLPVYGNVIWGVRTMDGDNDRGSEWKYIPVRRTALFLEESLYRGTQWVVFEPNDEPLWAQIRLNIGAFMQGLFRQGAFQGSTPKQAYFVKCDSQTTTQADINLGIVNIFVGFAPLKPAEFVILKIQQIAGDLAA